MKVNSFEDVLFSQLKKKGVGFFKKLVKKKEMGGQSTPLWTAWLLSPPLTAAYICMQKVSL